MPPEECTFTKRLVRSEALVVGTVTGTDTLPTDWSPGYRSVLPENRVSHLLVEEAVFGPSEAGDTLRVMWTDLADYDIVLAGPDLNLDAWEGERALWLVGTRDSTWRAYSPTLMSRTWELENRLSWIRDPPFCSRLSVGTLSESERLKLSKTEDWLVRQVQVQAREMP
jgi:hypothetical protein